MRRKLWHAVALWSQQQPIPSTTRGPNARMAIAPRRNAQQPNEYLIGNTDRRLTAAGLARKGNSEHPVKFPSVFSLCHSISLATLYFPSHRLRHPFFPSNLLSPFFSPPFLPPPFHLVFLRLSPEVSIRSK